MKTRRIFLQPGEPVEIINQYGTSVLKAVAPFHYEQACVVIYEQPGVCAYAPSEAKELDLSDQPAPPTAEMFPKFTSAD